MLNVCVPLFFILKQNSYSDSTMLDPFFKQNNDSHQVASGPNKKAVVRLPDPCVRNQDQPKVVL